MMNRVVSVFMGLLFMLIIGQQALLIVHFKFNQEVIEKKYCVNKDKPQLECHGKCQLKKQLTETEEQNITTLSIYKLINLIPVSSLIIEIKPSFSCWTRKVYSYQGLRLMTINVKIVIPPPMA